MSINHGCVSAVAKLVAWRAVKGQRSCSTATGAYCIARDRLDEASMQRLVTQSGAAIDSQTPDHWLWKNHEVIVADGATVTMADTLENQKEYPQLGAQKPGCGFPIMRMLVLFALSTGAVLEVALGKYAGKFSHEVSLFRMIDALIQKGNVFLADRAFAGWFEMVRMKMRGAHYVLRMHQKRKANFRTGIRYGKDDHAIRLEKPDRPKWMSKEEYEQHPDFIIVREVRIRVQQKGFRTKEIIIHTSFEDDIEYSQEDIGLLFRRRWQAELDLRSIKTTMKMDVLRCKTPELVRKEIWTHILAYNLIRTIMAQAATQHDVPPRTISFKGAIQTLGAFQPLLAFHNQYCKPILNQLFQHVLAIIIVNRVADRPGWFEPRRRKRRDKAYGRLM